MIALFHSHSAKNGTDCVPCIMSNRPDAAEFGRFIKYFLASIITSSLVPPLSQFLPGPPYFINTLKSPYNDSNIRNVPTIPPNNDQQNPPPVTSYDPVDHTPSAPPSNYQNHHQYNGYAPPTRPNATQPHEATLYPDLQALHQEEQVYPAATRPHDGYSQVDEKSRLLTN